MFYNGFCFEILGISHRAISQAYYFIHISFGFVIWSRLSNGLKFDLVNTRVCYGAAIMAEKKCTKEKVGEKPQKKDEKVSKKAVKSSPVPSTLQATDTDILTIMKSIQDSIIKQNSKVDSLTSRMVAIENLAEDDYEHYYEECGEHRPGEGEIGDYPDYVQNLERSSASTGKRSASDPSRFDSMAKKFHAVEHVDKDVDSTLALNVNELFHKGIDANRYEELVKDENSTRPENCEGLTVVKTNRLIWDAVSHNARLNDKKLQNIELSVVKAATILTKTVNNTATLKKDCQEFSPLIDSCNNVLALFGHSNRQINLARKDFLKPELKYEYAHLCNHSVPFTSGLFGDDVGKQACEIEDINKLGTRIQKGAFAEGRGRAGFRRHFRTRGRGLPVRGKPYNPGYGYTNQSNLSKNQSRRGPSLAGRSFKQ